MRARRVAVAVVVLATVSLALVAGLAARSHDRAHDTAVPCHAQVNCIGQIASVPLGTSALPGTATLVVAALALVTRLDVAPAGWTDRLVAGRLFRPPRFLG